MTLRPRYLRGLAQERQQGPSNWLTTALVIVHRWPVLTLEGVMSMDPKTLSEYVNKLVAEQGL